MPLAAPPPQYTPIPPTIARWAAAHHYTVAQLVWRNELGGITARLIRDGHPTVYAKHVMEDPVDEAEHLSWLHGRFPCPAMADYVEHAAHRRRRLRGHRGRRGPRAWRSVG